MVMLDRREAMDTVNFPFKGHRLGVGGFRAGPGDEGHRPKYPPIRQIRGVYTWGWRVHPPRIQFLQPVYEIRTQNTGLNIELDPQGESYVDP